MQTNFESKLWCSHSSGTRVLRLAGSRAYKCVRSRASEIMYQRFGSFNWLGNFARSGLPPIKYALFGGTLEPNINSNVNNMRASQARLASQARHARQKSLIPK